MFGSSKSDTPINEEQLELFKNARRRIKQKRRLYAHFVIFLIGALFLIIANTVLDIGLETFGPNWFVYAISFWLFLFLYHVFNVFITNKFMGDAWEEAQLKKLIAKQEQRIESLKKTVEKDYPLQQPSNVDPEKKTKLTNDVTIIVAAAENDAIGKDNQLIWHLSADLKRFKTLTSGHCIIMGRKTFESFPKPLPNRTHIVISRQANYKVPAGVIVVNNLEDALDAAKDDKQPFIIGGGEIYKQAMTYATNIELTRVHASFDADTFFPKIDSNIWKETQSSYHPKDDNHDYAFTFLSYERR
uniref:dihydrofolate reductase n=1 Tax=Gelidibacter sp. TaxID=2018083 RepID=UPI00404A53F5